jgi:hypothetical protein
VALSYANARTILQSRIADSSNSTAVDQAIDQAQREVARSRRWPELIGRKFFNTVAAYETGTVAVTNASTTVTLTGGTWPSDVASGLYRFALSTSGPWYGVATRSSDTVILLAQAYIGASDTSTDYIAYKSHYSLDSSVDRVEEMWLHETGGAVPLVNAATDEQVTEFLHHPSGPGVPTHFYNMERDASDNRQVLLGPETPDAVYRVEYVYKRKTTDGSLSLDESRWPVVLARASAILYEPDYYDRSLREMERYRQLLDEEWARETEGSVQHVRVGDTRVRYPGHFGYLDNLMGFGRVADPS